MGSLSLPADSDGIKNMFSPADRSALRAQLVVRAEKDPHIVGAALVGSSAHGTEDDWSDIDLALQLCPEADEPAVVADWSRAIDNLDAVADTTDIFAAGARFRVFFLQSSLQIDVAFWPHNTFRQIGPGFHLLFGTPNDPTEPAPVDAAKTIGMGWLYAIHARSAIARGKVWQADMMLNDLRTTVTTLKCVRAGLNPHHGREVDLLPAVDLAELEASRATSVTIEALDRGRMLLTRQFLNEIALHDRDRFERLRAPFAELCHPVR